MGRFTTENEIFESLEPLQHHYSPDELHEREDKLDELGQPLKPVMNKGAPENVFVYGKPGTGKTASVNHIVDELGEAISEMHDEELTKVHIQCRKYNSTYQLAIKIINDLREQRNDDADLFSETGHPKQTVYRILYDELDRAGSYVILVLDEFDRVEKDRDEFLRNISRALAEGEVTDTKPGIITITNGFTFVDGLDPETKDSLDAEEIVFEEYTPDQLSAILEARADKAFKDGALNEDVVRYCAATVAKHSGSARRACQLLRKAGKVARDDDPDAEAVQIDHVDIAKQQVYEERRIAGLRDLGVHAHCAVISLIEKTELNDDNPDGSPVRTRDLYEYYTQFADFLGEEPLSNKRFRERLNDLSRKGYVEQTKSYTAGHSAHTNGQSDHHKLKADIETAVSALEESIHDGVPKKAEKLREDAEEKNIISSVAD